MNTENISDLIIDLEIKALERWNNGDPDGYLEISDEDVVYFDPFLEKRLDGRQGLAALYATLRGKIKVDNYELIDPLVQVNNNAAVLTFNLLSYSGQSVYKWHCTEVYFFKENSWRIVQTHWSFAK